MKNVVFCLLFLAVPNFASAQSSISLNELISMRKGGISVINRNILMRGWVFKGKSEEVVLYNKDCDFKSLVWVYSPAKQTDLSTAFIVLSKNESCNFLIYYQWSDDATYNKIQNSIDALGVKLIKSSVSDDGSNMVVEGYAGNGYIITVTVTPRRDKVGKLYNGYSITLGRKE